ncbi:MAG: hypothetical protein WBH97_00845 [Rectinemataceae bacterium]
MRQNHAALRVAGARYESAFFILTISAALAVVIALCGCSGGGLPIAQRLILTFPALPESWAAAGDISYVVEWIDRRGEPVSAVSGPGGELEIEVPLGFSQPILAYPFIGRNRMHPAGGLYPLQVRAAAQAPFSMPFPGERVELALGFESGYAAEVARIMENSGFNPWKYPLERLEESWKGRVADPWSLQAESVAEKLAVGTFRADLFREAERFPVTLPGPGPWLHESPFAARVGSDSGSGCPVELPAGLHRFAGSSCGLSVLVDDDGTACWVRTVCLRMPAPQLPQEVPREEDAK